MSCIFRFNRRSFYFHFALSGVVFAFALNISQPALAYLDPGTGSIMLQLLLGGIASGLIIAKMYWHRLHGWLARGTGNESQRSSEHAPGE